MRCHACLHARDFASAFQPWGHWGKEWATEEVPCTQVLPELDLWIGCQDFPCSNFSNFSFLFHRNLFLMSRHFGLFVRRSPCRRSHSLRPTWQWGATGTVTTVTTVTDSRRWRELASRSWPWQPWCLVWPSAVCDHRRQAMDFSWIFPLNGWIKMDGSGQGESWWISVWEFCNDQNSGSFWLDRPSDNFWKMLV